MPEENDVGAAYLAALKRSAGSPATGVAASRASDTPADTSSPKPIATGRTGPIPEKRRSPRYRCQGSAQLRDVQSGVATWATFSDISLHGCYVEAASCYPVGSSLTLTIEVNSFRVEVIGEVRITYPGLGMGISFTQVSDEYRARLRELIRSISQPSVIMGARPALECGPVSPSVALPALPNPTAALQAIQKFFEDRHVMGREEFLRILRKSQP
jgi:hypothetical protein